jgi:hypothetical protein
VKVAPLPKVVKKPDLKGIQAEQAMRFQSLKGTDLKDRPNFDPKEDEGTGKPSLKEGQLLRLGVGGPRREASSDVTKVTPRGGQATTFDLSKSLAASDLQDLLMSDTVKEGAGGNIREDLGKAKGLGVGLKERGSVLGDSVGREGGKTLEPNGGAPGSIGKFRKGMGLSRGITDGIGNRRSRVMETTLFEYTDPNGKNWSILLVPKSELDGNGEWRPKGEVQAHDGAIAVDDVLIDAAMGGSDEAYDELVMIVQGGIDRNTTKNPPLAPLTSDGDTDDDDSFEWASWLGGSKESGDSGGSTDELPPLAPLTSDEDSGDSTDSGDSGDSTDGDSFQWAWEDSDSDSEASMDDDSDDDDDDDSETSERGVLGGEQENSKGGSGNLNGKRFRGIVVGGFTGSGGGDTVRTGEMTGRGGPLAKDPKSGNSGHPTVRTDPDALREGMLDLGKIDDILAGKDGPINFGEEGDPRGQPKPEGEAGTEGPRIAGGSPGVVTRNSKAANLKKLGSIQGEATRGIQAGRVEIKEVEIKEGSQLKAK